ncbi:RNA polymerase sigma-70 factor, ECF subfamily [Tistlia consotensis]|uniref:RNA polymerase sigma-70 factor, ECF subfamily n=1 Tax=Tistlia consotensis USBA 355 TaxID=560819 RepID=A0A1Y6BKI6_9PROT|nr:sigma-70 family RNA polymerase sigma factor [Tistlia consotensis]SMF14076.1 RNA polymerase sigma-70 factor, ECF subfamily [Tistlia consotensis USBA 355]SNR49903.1 RNA polymerase sigma-70 factor, ECF subfamily [Tistlia consotensis]
MTERHERTNGFELALLELMPLLHVWARRRTGSADAAGDLLQDTLLRALQARDGFSPGTNLRAWLFMIMRNLAADEGRRRTRRGPHLSLELAVLALGVAPRQDSELALRDLNRAFARLTDEQQDLLLRVAVGDETYLDLATAYGIAVGTVKSRVARARASLRRQMDEPAPHGQHRAGRED